MCKSDAPHLVVSTSALFLFLAATPNPDTNSFSIAQATVQQADSPGKTRQILDSQMNGLIRRNGNPASIDLNQEAAGAGADVQADFSSRLQGGELLRFDFGLIVVQPTKLPESAQPTAFTADAIITSSLKSKIAAQAQLQSENFDIETDNGVVKIHAKEDSLDQALEVINIALTVTGVRQIIYTMPAGYQV
ncbi:MAG TPA: BON domain-containing protein [Chthoniobacterales bacterium]|nr:BON domain-containing protein [Chthoniobacterales bacterium]